MFSLICAWLNGSVNSGEAGDLRRHRAHYDVTVMMFLYHIATVSMYTMSFLFAGGPNLFPIQWLGKDLHVPQYNQSNDV